MAVYRPTWTDKKTGETRESKTWWFEFIYSGKRVRKSAKTTRKTIALEAEKDERRRLERARAGVPTESHANRIRTVAEALDAYSAAYKVNHRPKSIAVVAERSVHLERLLGSRLLPDLTAEKVTGYMAARQGEGAGNRTINIELGVLSRAIGHEWRLLWPKVKKLEENNDIGRALEPAEEKAILDAAQRSRSPLIYPYLMLLAWTGLRSDEGRILRWFQVDFAAGHVTVGKSKTDRGKGRQVPMTAALRAVFQQHMAWSASVLGPIQPDWYVFPFSRRVKPVDPAKPVTSLKRGWEAVRDKAGVSCRLHDLRHSFCTKLAEAGVPESTMLDIMGHMSAAMLRRYSHIRAKARREAMTAVESGSVVGVLQEVPKVSRPQASKPTVTH
jgi:integrase